MSSSELFLLLCSYSSPRPRPRPPPGWHTVFQPLFKALSKVWYGLEEEAEQLKILHNIMLNLQPFKASQAKLFPADYLDGLLKDSEVKTDEKRAMESSGIGRRRQQTCLFSSSSSSFLAAS